MNGRLFIALCALGPVQALAIERLDVEVVCQLAEHRYRLGLSAQQITTTEADCSRQVAELFRRNIGFLEFSSGTPTGNRLVVRIGKTSAEANPDAFRPVNIDMWVEGDKVLGDGDVVSWTFRTLDEYLQVPAPSAFADAITLRMSDELQKNEAFLVKSQLGRLQIATSAYPMPEDQSWLLPFTRGELGVADDTQFNIRAELEMPTSKEHFTYTVALFGDYTSGAGVPEEFFNTVKALHLGDDKLAKDDSIRRLQLANHVVVLQVSVVRYVPAAAPVHTSPSELRLE